MAKNSLSNTKINVTFKSLLHANGEQLPEDIQEDIYDGSGNKSALKLGRSCNGATVCGPFVCGALSAGDINVGNISAGNIAANSITGTFNGNNLLASSQFNLIDLCNVIYPVGAIILNITGISPASQFPNTGWNLVAQGRVLLGVGLNTDARNITKNYSYPGEHEGYYQNVAYYNVPDHRHVTGGFADSWNDDWYPIYIGGTAVTTTTPYGGYSRWIAGESGNGNWRSISTTYGTGTGLPYSRETWGTPEFDVRNPAYAVYTWKRYS